VITDELCELGSQSSLHMRLEVRRMAMRIEPILREPPASGARMAPAAPPITLSAAWFGWQGTAKRVLDVLVAFWLLVALAPVLTVIALLVRLDSPGPVIFRQIRVGRNGRYFRFLKFRGMVEDAEARLREVECFNEADGPIFKMREDPRVTRVGRVLRRTSLDELPQLWNVLRGEMSLVGPRPPLPSEVDRYEPWQRNRLLTKPGMTGLWQTSGRSDIGFERMVQLDLQYIEHWSLWLDLRILLATIGVVFRGVGAY
jgi:exopolysaccharide biosynthesis polyprenyl glycosylphosphotransferase